MHSSLKTNHNEYSIKNYSVCDRLFCQLPLLGRDGLSSAAKVDFSKPHAPLLIVSSSADNIVPASLNKCNFKRYKQNNGSVTEYLEVADRNHHVLGLPTWQTDAQQILDWIGKH